MTKEQKEALTKLLSDEGIKGKELIKRVLWLNDSSPKFNVGDCYKVTDRGHRLYGNEIVNFNGKIVEITRSKFANEFVYKFEVIAKLNEEKECVSSSFIRESVIGEKADDNINYVEDKR